MKSPAFYGRVAALLIILFDQITKGLALSYVSGQQIALLPFFNLVIVWNKGVSFGMLSHGGDMGPLILIGLSLVIVIFFAIWLFRTDDKFMALAIGAIIGGAVGNVIDRVRFGAVVDFLDFHALGWHYPAFNVADSSIVIGIAFLAVDAIFREPKRRSSEKE